MHLCTIHGNTCRKRVQLEELEAENSDLRAQVVALKQTIARLRRGGGHVDDEDDHHSIPDHKHSGARHTGRTNPDHNMDEDLSDLDAEADDDDDDDDGADEDAVGDVEPGAGVTGGSGLSSGNKARLRNTKAQGASGEDETDSVMSAVDVESKPAIKLGTSHNNNGASTSTSGSTSTAAALGFAPPKPPAAPGNKPPSSGPSDFTALAALVSVQRHEYAFLLTRYSFTHLAQGRAASRAARHDRHVESGISSSQCRSSRSKASSPRLDLTLIALAQLPKIPIEAAGRSSFSRYECW